MFNFSYRMHGAMVDGKPIKPMEISLWRIHWHRAPGAPTDSPGREVRNLERLVA